MKPRNREVNIFNLSMLDVISGALGALIIIMVVLFPFYGKERTEDEFQRLRNRVQELEDENQRLEERLRAVEKRRPFVVFIEWYAAKHDVDLWVDDGTSSYAPGHVGTEKKWGPGMEVQLVRDAPIGMKWEVVVRLKNRNGNPEKCTLNAYYMDARGLHQMGSYTIPQEGKWYRIGRLVMTEREQLAFSP
jgi:hypothetical protein